MQLRLRTLLSEDDLRKLLEYALLIDSAIAQSSSLLAQAERLPVAKHDSRTNDKDNSRGGGTSQSLPMP
jgi:hypothetical protein